MSKNSAYVIGIRQLGWDEVNGIYNCWSHPCHFVKVELGSDHGRSSFFLVILILPGMFLPDVL